MPNLLDGRSVLVVEDNYLIAQDFGVTITAVGGHAIGPIATVEQALSVIEASPHFDAALVDMSLRGRPAEPVVDALLLLAKPAVLISGLDLRWLPERHRHLPRFAKPVHPVETVRRLVVLLGA